jgi:thymidylate synthase (FAD)
MSRNVEIKVYPIAKSVIDKRQVAKWLDEIGAVNVAKTVWDDNDDCDIPPQSLPATDPAFLIAMAAKRCYMSFEEGLNPNVNRVRKDLTEYIDNILKSGHGSVLEHAVYTFAIEGVSRVFTGEMNRHRAGVGISEGSMRFIRYTDIPWWLPTSLQSHPDDSVELRRKKVLTRDVFATHFRQTEENYKALQEIWAEELAPESKFAGKKHVTSMMRRIIPMGVATGGVWTMNLRAVRHILALRASPAAEEEILHVFSQIGKIMVEAEPMLFGDFNQTPEGFWVPKYPKV